MVLREVKRSGLTLLRLLCVSAVLVSPLAQSALADQTNENEEFWSTPGEGEGVWREIPYLGKLDSSGGSCTGAIVGPCAVVTAAHCAPAASTFEYFDKEGKKSSATKVDFITYSPPANTGGGNKKIFDGIDLALFLTRGSQNWTPAQISEPPAIEYGEGKSKDVMVIGFGGRNNPTKRPYILQKSYFDSVGSSIAESRPKLPEYRAVGGDSGGPLIYNGKVIGVNRGNIATVNTVHNFNQRWIEEKVNEAKCDAEMTMHFYQELRDGRQIPRYESTIMLHPFDTPLYVEWETSGYMVDQCVLAFRDGSGNMVAEHGVDASGRENISELLPSSGYFEVGLSCPPSPDVPQNLLGVLTYYSQGVYQEEWAGDPANQTGGDPASGGGAGGPIGDPAGDWAGGWADYSAGDPAGGWAGDPAGGSAGGGPGDLAFGGWF